MFEVEFSGDQFEEYEQLKVVYSSVKVIKSEESIERMRERKGRPHSPLDKESDTELQS